jgi:hypothetical protein
MKTNFKETKMRKSEHEKLIRRVKNIEASASKAYRLANARKIKDSRENYSGNGHMIIMGDDAKFWVIKVAKALFLQKHGYEIIK